MDTHVEQYYEEVMKREIGTFCYQEAKKIWNKAKKTLTENKSFSPFVYYDNSQRNHVFCAGKNDQELDKLIELSADESSDFMVITPLRLSEFFSKRFKLGEEYIRFEIASEIEKDLIFQAERANFSFFQQSLNEKVAKRKGLFFIPLNITETSSTGYPRVLMDIKEKIERNFKNKRTVKN
ncbi:hypothetical protein NSQ59_27635 [Margalitia sp. FSL K6-0131]|uniref:hypothetical protein n=1 Tax=Margalitia sp. FSL K6-0131 TaxID=2954604 RepID=UPI0030F8B481